MFSDDLEDYLDLRRADLDPEGFAAALAVQHIRSLITAGGIGSGHLDGEEVLSPQHVAAFLARAVEAAHKSGRFEQEWRRLQQLVPQLQAAWERGQGLFQEDLARATANPEEMDYLAMSDFAETCYATIDARRTYPNNPVQQAWSTSGYMLAWWQFFLMERDMSLSDEGEVG